MGCTGPPLILSQGQSHENLGEGGEVTGGQVTTREVSIEMGLLAFQESTSDDAIAIIYSLSGSRPQN